MAGTRSTPPRFPRTPLVFAVGASGLNIISGFAGYVSLGQGAFVGLDGYTIGVLARGRMMATGTPDEIQRDPAVIDAYLGDDFAIDEKVQAGARRPTKGRTTARCCGCRA